MTPSFIVDSTTVSEKIIVPFFRVTIAAVVPFLSWPLPLYFLHYCFPHFSSFFFPEEMSVCSSEASVLVDQTVAFVVTITLASLFSIYSTSFRGVCARFSIECGPALSTALMYRCEWDRYMLLRKWVTHTLPFCYILCGGVVFVE